MPSLTLPRRSMIAFSPFWPRWLSPQQRQDCAFGEKARGSRRKTFASAFARTAVFPLLFLAGALFAPAAHAQYFALGKGAYPLEFYDIDFSYLADPANRTGQLDALHYIPVGIGSEAYLSLGGEFRQQFWSWNNAGHGLRAPLQNTYDLERIVGDIYFHFDRHLAVFLQLARYDAFNRISPSTTDQDRGRIQQGFIELKEPVGPADVTARLGRQEIFLGSGRFVWINDSSNVRTTQDGVRLRARFPNEATLDLAVARPVTSVLDAFSDWDTHSGVFGAAYASQVLLPNQLHLDEYYFYRRNIGAQYVGLAGNEDRHTVGGRVWGAFGPLLYDGDFAYQFGTFNNKAISAFGASTRVLYSFESLPWNPGLQLQTSYFSGGGGPNSKTIGTFSAPFPRPTMLNYAGLETLENLIEVYPAFIVSPTPTFAFRFGPEILWRASRYDAVYVSRATPLPKTMTPTDTAAYIGTNLVATAQWRLAPNIILFGEYLHELAGPAITLAGGHGADVGVVQIDFNF
ncbi:conserved hypothetical protein [Methylocella tundrae]|uniref:Alginate export domain-containing protein n=1 Tax=Methylocella tundrae TaxID=227605 RepID=A0A8B6MC60_METTU|nr:conserved hypothetical protein [Methylocella tundrae]